MNDQTAIVKDDPLRATAAKGPFEAVAVAALAAAGAALVLLTLVEAWQVFARYVLDRPPAWTEPVALLCLKCALMLAAAVAVRNETHFRFLLGVHAARGALREAMLAAARLTAVGLGLAFVLWGGRMTLEQWTFKMPGAPLPAGLYYAPFVLGGALFALFAAERLLYRFDAAEGDD